MKTHPFGLPPIHSFCNRPKNITYGIAATDDPASAYSIQGDTDPGFIDVGTEGKISADWQSYLKGTSSTTNEFKVKMTNKNDSIVVPISYTVEETEISVKDQGGADATGNAFKFITYKDGTVKYLDLSVTTGTQDGNFNVTVKENDSDATGVLEVRDNKVYATSTAEAGEYTLDVTYSFNGQAYDTVEGIPVTIEADLTVDDTPVGEGYNQSKTLKAIVDGTNSFDFTTNVAVILTESYTNVAVGGGNVSLSFNDTTGTITLNGTGATAGDTAVITFTGSTAGGQTFSYEISCLIVNKIVYTSTPSNGVDISLA